MSQEDVPWWRDAVVYQIYPRSFADTDGDGVGDLDGIRRHLDHVAQLGAAAIWLSPVYPSPMADNGYDVSDYCDIDPVFGNLATFDALLAEAHARGIKLLLDWVANHTSDQHPWFQQSRSSRDNPYRDWYYWRDGRDGDPAQPPNNWRSAFGNGPAWSWADNTQQWYLHDFLPQQPDLNWNNPAVQAAMHGTLRFWLDRGVDGFRMDVIHLIGKDPALPDAPPEEAHTNRVGFHDDPRTHVLLRGIRGLLDSYPGDRMAVGEVNLRDTSRLATYYGEHRDELNLVFNFNTLRAGWDADRWIELLEEVDRDYVPTSWPTWVLSNHDVSRHRTRLASDEKARALAVLLLTLRGTPFLYAGEELGLEDAVVPPDRIHDVAGRDGCRAPIPWRPDPPHGWDGTTPWLPFPPNAQTHNPVVEEDDDASMLQLYRHLLEARRSSTALRRGHFARRDAGPGILAYTREDDGDVRAVIVNFNDRPVHVPCDGMRVEVSSDARQPPGTSYDGTVAPAVAVLLRPTSAR